MNLTKLLYKAAIYNLKEVKIKSSRGTKEIYSGI